MVLGCKYISELNSSAELYRYIEKKKFLLVSADETNLPPFSKSPEGAGKSSN